MRRGAATGPQAPEEQPEGEAQARFAGRDKDTRLRGAYDASVARMAEDAQRILAALEQFPAGSYFQPATDVPLGVVNGLEQQLGKLRTQVEQLSHGVTEA